MGSGNEKKTNIEERCVIDVEENFRGRSYGDWVATWANWLLSEDPDRSNEDDQMLFLRGSLAYYEYAERRKDLNSLPDAQRFYNRTGDQCLVISEGTAIFIPVLTALYFIGGPFEGSTLADEQQVRYAVRKENDKSGGIWARLQGADRSANTWRPIVNNLESYRVESPLFKLTISEKNPFLKYYAVEYPLGPGEYNAVVDGYFLIMKELPFESCRIQFGGKGRGDYRTDSVYDMHVIPRPKGLIKDISQGNTHPGAWFQFDSSDVPTHNLPKLQKL
jgi:hypothetical protein